MERSKSMLEPPEDAYTSLPRPLPSVGDERTKEALPNVTTLYCSNPGQGGDMQAHRPLTLFRRVRGIVCLIILLATAFVALVILAPVAFLFLRLFSVHYSRYWTSFFMGRWLSMWPYLFEQVNETKVIFAGDRVPCEDRVMLLCNHRTEVDWMYIWNLALRKGKLGYCKYAVKSSVKNMPIFGWSFYVFEFLMLDRRWQVDGPVIKTYLQSFQDPRDPIWLILFPEGTDFTDAKRDRGNAFAKENGYPELVNVLQPRTRGFVACLSQLRGSLDAVYDLTIGYKNRCPLFINNLYGTDPAEVHIHIRRIPLSEIPESEEDMSRWLYGVFQEKDQILAAFSQQGSFSESESVEEPLNTGMGLFNFLLHLGPSIWVIWCLFNSHWLQLYVAFICVVLAFGTYFDWRPSPLYSSVRIKRKTV